MCRPADVPPFDPFPDYDGPDPEPVDDVDVPVGACWCPPFDPFPDYDGPDPEPVDDVAAPCPELAAVDRDPADAYRDRP